MSDVLTDEELENAAEMAEAGIPESPRVTRRIVAEVRRLRSDDWLHAAIEAYYGTNPDPEISAQRERLFERLCKHRDGKA